VFTNKAEWLVCNSMGPMALLADFANSTTVQHEQGIASCTDAASMSLSWRVLRMTSNTILGGLILSDALSLSSQ